MFAARILLFFVVATAVGPTLAEAYWWSLASSSIRNAALSQLPDCSQLDQLSRNQRALCMKYGSMMRYVSEGAGLGIAECQNQFRDERWNCTTVDSRSVFGRVVSVGSKETAFTEDERPIGLNRRWTWAGCGDNTEFAYGFAREFVDAKERDNAAPKNNRERARKAMNLHNNEAGRMVAIHASQPTCRCHGTSGSCNLKTCWNEIPKFEKIGAALKKRYDAAVEVNYVRRGNRFRPRVASAHVERKSLVFLESSPDYCRRNRRMGIRGTRGRRCDERSAGTDSCSSMCCGRGYTSEVSVVSRECNCKFEWCCTVRCETCTNTTRLNICS